MCQRFPGISYREIVSTPTDLLVIRERLGWSDEMLKATPSRVVRDFIVIAEHEAELANR